MTTSIRTPELAMATEALTSLIADAKRGGADIQQGRMIIGASNGVCRAVKTDIERRLAAPKIAAVEAKLIEAETQPHGKKQLAA